MARYYIEFPTVALLNAEVKTTGRTAPAVLEDTDPETADHAAAVAEAPAALDQALPAADTANGSAREKGGVSSSHAMDFADLLAVLCRSSELAECRLRLGDRGHLNEKNQALRFRLSNGSRGGRDVREDWHKVFVLVQSQLSRMEFDDISLRSDAARVWSSLPRVAKFVHDYAVAVGHFSAIKHSLMLVRCVERKL